MSTTTSTAPSTKVITGVVRLSFPHIWESAAIGDSTEKKYSASLIIDKKDATTKAKIEAAVKAAIEVGKGKWGGTVPKKLKLPLRDGDAEKDDEAYENSYFVNASSKNKPGVLDEQKNEMLNKEDLYAGCYVKADLNFYPFDFNGTKGIACGLNNLMKVKDGEKLGGGGQSAEEAFKDIDADDDF